MGRLIQQGSGSFLALSPQTPSSWEVSNSKGECFNLQPADEVLYASTVSSWYKRDLMIQNVDFYWIPTGLWIQSLSASTSLDSKYSFFFKLILERERGKERKRGREREIDLLHLLMHLFIAFWSNYSSLSEVMLLLDQLHSISSLEMDRI